MIYMTLIKKAYEILQEHVLCDICLGLLFGSLATNTTNKKRGFSIKLILTMEMHSKILNESAVDDAKKTLLSIAKSGFLPAKSLLLKLYGLSNISEEKCYLCEDLFKKLDFYASLVDQRLKESNIEFNSFQIASKISSNILVRAEELKSRFELPWAESFKKVFNRELGKLVQKKINKSVIINSSDILINVDTIKNKISFSIKSVYIYGFYKKLIRGIPQSTWGKHKLKDEKPYPTSIEELLKNVIMPIFEGDDVVLHAAGREDIDARMLGKGRPCVIEIKSPKKRSVELDALESIINSELKNILSVKLVSYVNKEFLVRLKEKGEKTKKVYYAIVELGRNITKDELRLLEDVFSNRIIVQKTPLRVLHRRGDKIRHKKVYKLTVMKHNQNIIELKIITQGGLYVKELISGDNGRTSPSIAEILNTNAKCLILDVLDVIMEDDSYGEKE